MLREATNREGRLGNTGKECEVLQLLRYYRDWHTAYGGASELNLESLGQYGPAGMIVAGMLFSRRTNADRRAWAMFRDSFDLLEKALRVLKGEDFGAWMGLLVPYLGDPADIALVDDWREKARDEWKKTKTGWVQTKRGYISAQRFLEKHDRAITTLAGYLKDHDLYVPRPGRMSTRKPETVEQMNDEFYALYEKLRKDGEGKTKAVRTAAEWCGYGERRGWDIVKLREMETSQA